MNDFILFLAFLGLIVILAVIFGTIGYNIAMFRKTRQENTLRIHKIVEKQKENINKAIAPKFPE